MAIIAAVAIPVIEAILHRELRERERDKPGGQRPAGPGRFALPESGRGCPEPAKQLTFSHILVLCHFGPALAAKMPHSFGKHRRLCG
jgi:hypothetical protein